MIQHIIGLLVLAIVCIIIFGNAYGNAIEPFRQNNHFCVIVTTYNPGPSYIKKCLDIIEKQTYKQFRVCIVDDASTKKVSETHNIINDYCNRNNWQFVKRNINIGPLGARIDAINRLNPNDEDIIISIDGDDELYDTTIFEKLNSIYQDNTLITFGNYIENINGVLGPPKIKCRKHNFAKIIRKHGFRKYNWVFTHLKTFKYKLYKEINHDDLKLNGEYLKAATDIALMIPMLEMAGKNFKCVQNILYKYNREHPESNNIVSGKVQKQRANHKYIKRLPSYETKFT
jgi:glycosyltransferase involved in cell wall biosynthesis